jgi:hypothetical protein
MCHEWINLVSVDKAAKIAGVCKRTIYRYIDEGLIYQQKLVGKTLRVCPKCLFRRNSEH